MTLVVGSCPKSEKNVVVINGILPASRGIRDIAGIFPATQ